MTILTKTSQDNKPQQTVTLLQLSDDDIPIVLGRNAAIGHRRSDADTESHVTVPSKCILIRSILVIFLTCIVITIGIATLCTVNQSRLNNMHSRTHHRRVCKIPYSQQDWETVDNFNKKFYEIFHFYPTNAYSDSFDNHFFREEFDLNLNNNGSYAKVNIPDFKDGRSGSFLHDFKDNQSAIVDLQAGRCFVMPLDLNTVLPPEDMLDLLEKTANGYYDIDTERIRRDMHIVMPAMKNFSNISENIVNECFGLKIYQLKENDKEIEGVFQQQLEDDKEKDVENEVKLEHNIVKRSIKQVSDAGKFAHFFGKGIIEFNLINIADIEKLERGGKQ